MADPVTVTPADIRRAAAKPADEASNRPDSKASHNRKRSAHRPGARSG